jgi:hypothetical protein
MAAIAGALDVKNTLDQIQSKVRESLDGIKQIVSGTVQSLTETFHSLKTQMFDSVSLYRPFAIVQFNRALMDLHATFGQMMLPTVRDLTSIVRNLADMFFSLPRGIKDALSAFSKIALVLGPLISVGVVIGGIVAALVAALAAAAAGTVAIVATVAGAVVLTGISLGTFAAIAAGAVLITVALAAALAAVAIGVVAALAGLIQFTRMLINTAGGQRLLANLNKAWDQLMAGFKAAIGFIQSSIGPAWDALNAALSEFGDSLSELLEALKPLAAGIIVVGAAALTIAFNLIAQGLTWITKQLSTFARFLSRTFTGLFGGMPTLPKGEERKSSFGLGWSGGAVLDPNTMYNKITEELLKASRGPDAQTQSKTALEKIEKHTDTIQRALGEALIWMKAGAETAGKAIGTAADFAADPLGTMLSMIP